MTAPEILSALKPLGRESYKRMMMKNYGVREPFDGVPIGDLKGFQKRIKKDYQLALDLYATGHYDAMYLAGLIADDARMTREDLNRWVEQAYAGSLIGTTVPSVAAGSAHGWDLAREWIGSPQPLTAAAGWATLGSLVSIKPDAALDVPELQRLLERVPLEIAAAPDVVRYQMNHFVIAAGCYVPALTALALRLGEEMGPISAHVGENSCEVFYAPDYIRKVQARGTLGKKRKSARC